MKVGIGSDRNGQTYREEIQKYLEALGYETVIFQEQEASDDYPDIAVQVAEAILNQEITRGVLICGTGIGMAIAANKVPGIRAAVGHDFFSVQRSVLSNNAQIITFGQQIIGEKLMLSYLEEFLKLEFVEGRSTPKLKKISGYEQEYQEKKRGR